MTLKLVKPGSYTFKYEGKRKTSYRVIFRQGDVHLDEKLDEKRATSDRAAVQLAQRRISDALKSPKGKAPAMVKIEDLGREVVESKLTPSTRRDAHYWVFTRLIPYMRVHCPFIVDFNEGIWDDYILWEQRNRPGTKLFNCRKYMSQIVHRAAKRGIVTKPMRLRNPDPKRAAGKVFTDAEIKALLAKADDELRLQILMGYAMGMRRSEILHLQWDRIDLRAGVIHLRREDTKIRQARSFKVPAVLLESLRLRRLAVRGRWVFPSNKKPDAPILDNKTAWQACKRRAKVSGRFHDLRHTFLTHEIHVRKTPALDVCAYSGLSIEELKRTYLHPTVESTAYIADGLGDKLAALCGKFVEKREESAK
jgi:integrase